MSTLTIAQLNSEQRDYFRLGSTRTYEFRLRQLRRLRGAVQKFEHQILEALYEDMAKPEFEAFASEVGFIYEEISFAEKHLKHWMGRTRVSTPMVHAIAKSEIIKEPRGVVLIIGPWNYPFQLVFSPLIGAISAGNCSVLKPSECSPAIAKVISELIAETFDSQFISCVTGDKEVAKALLSEKWDYIFYTGGERVGKIVMESASRFLTPVTLELGGKSPCLVDSTADLKTTVRRILWGKFFNAGQTCVSPDYVLIQRETQDAFCELAQEVLREFYGDSPQGSPDYGRIINDVHFQRLAKLIPEAGCVVGGQTDEATRFIAPTIVRDVASSDPLMQEEIFGPILPLIPVGDWNEAIEFVAARPRPLACYLFSSDERRQNQALGTLSFGGGCVNDTLVHLTNNHLPFGGTGTSGMGQYHGRHSFETFSHSKSVMTRSFLVDPKLRYPPYGSRVSWLRKLLK